MDGDVLYGTGSGLIFLDDVECSGTEDTISHCRHSIWGSHKDYCNHNKDVGVICGMFTKYFYIYKSLLLLKSIYISSRH